MACNTSGAQVCTELQLDWSRTRVEIATFKTFSGGLFLGLFLTNVELMSNQRRTNVELMSN